MTEKMSQSQINALMNDSQFSQSQIDLSRATNKQSRPKIQDPKIQNQSYGEQQFESYEQSRKSFKKSITKNQQQQINKKQVIKKSLEEIKQQPRYSSSKNQKKSKQTIKINEKAKAKTGIVFYPQKKHIPFNYNNLQERQRQLLLTTLVQDNKKLKQALRLKQEECKKIQINYRKLLEQKTDQSASVKQQTLQKQLKILQQKYQKLQSLLKIQKQRTTFKSKNTNTKFIPQSISNQRQQQLLNVIDKLKQRLISTNTELKTLQSKMNQGQNYIQQLKRKMKRVQQLQYKIDKMAQQAQNDRQIIKNYQERNSKLDSQLHQIKKQKRLLEVQIRRYQLSNQTQNDLIKQLQQTKKQKDMLQRTLRDLAGNLNNISKKNNKQIVNIQDSGELLRIK